LPAPNLEADGRRYERIWVESFDEGLGTATVGQWSFETNLAYLHPSNARHRDGLLELALTSAPSGDRPDGRAIWGAEYDRTGPQLYGRFVTRFRPAAAPGVISSFFTAYYDFDPDYRLLETAEIDIEFVGGAREVQFALHWVDGEGVKRQTTETVSLDFDASEAFHEWCIDWTQDAIRFFVDGTELYAFSDPALLAEQAIPQEVKANIWVSGSVPWAGQFDEASLPQRALYDWIAAYRIVD
jgi:beta-glucanase (GH16 family)